MSAAINALKAALADRYELLHELGRGGMATVYLARDVRHARQVAIKVLHPELAAVLGAERFLAEIKTTANLQHPHILPLFDSGSADGQLFYVMPFVEGETLRVRLDRETQLPIADAVQLAREVADALQHAHDRGVIHRDIKPENILLQGGHALVADFGIALAVQQAGGQRMTQTGLSLGTPQYMAPEQAMGEKAVDARADIYALGAVTYEMLAGEPPYSGPTPQAIVAKVMTSAPAPLTSLRATVPGHVDRAVSTALAKLPADRLASAREFANALRAVDTATNAAARHTSANAPTARSWRPLAVGAVAVTILNVALWSFTARRETRDAPVIRAPIVAPPGTRLIHETIGGLAISPNGADLAFVVADSSGEKLVIRRGTEDYGRIVDVPRPRCLSFSPNGEWLAFVSDRSIKRIRVAGGRPETVTEVPAGIVRGMSWTSHDTLLFSVNGVFAVAALGERATAIRVDTAFYTFPLELSNGARIASQRGGGLFAQRADRTEWIDLRLAGTAAFGVEDGYLLYAARDSTIKAIAFDTDAIATSGVPFTVIDSVSSAPGLGAEAAWSASGSFVYMRGIKQNQLAFVSSSTDAPTLLPLAGPFSYPRLSPDGARIVVVRNSQLQVIDRVADITPILRRIGSGSAVNPEWLPDSRAIVFRTPSLTGALSIQIANADGTGTEREVAFGGRSISEAMLISNGRQWLVRSSNDAYDILTAPIDSPSVLTPVVATAAREVMPRLSPDGHWMAYESDELGEFHVFITPFPGPGARVPIGDNGGVEPLWSRDGRTVFYRLDNQIIALDLALESTPRVVRRRVAYVGSMELDAISAHPNYDVAPDGRFLVVRPVLTGQTPIVVYNWRREFREMLAARSKPQGSR